MIILEGLRWKKKYHWVTQKKKRANSRQGRMFWEEGEVRAKIEEGVREDGSFANHK